MSSAPSIINPNFTYNYSKYTCVLEVYYVHVFFAYVVTIAGFGCLITRLVRPLMWMHVWFGRLYWIAMLWTVATSLLIHNTGLPTGVIISFVLVIAGMSIGWIFINLHQIQMTTRATKQVEEQIKLHGLGIFEQNGSLERMIGMQKGKISMNKSFVERMFSWKAAHGAVMVTSWVNIIGRVFVTPLRNDFTCHTYPYYKQIDTKEFAGANAPLTPVPEVDPEYDIIPWAKTGLVGWGLALGLGPLLGSLLIGTIFAYVGVRRNQQKRSASARNVTPDEGRNQEKLLGGNTIGASGAAGVVTDGNGVS